MDVEQLKNIHKGSADKFGLPPVENIPAAPPVKPPKAAEPTKRCATCKNDLPATTDNFYRNKRKKDGLTSSCKKCQATIQAKSYYFRQGKEIPKETKSPNISAPKADKTAPIEENICDSCWDIEQVPVTTAVPLPENIPTIPSPEPTKICRSCDFEKPLSHFPADSGRADGRETRCRQCRADQRRQRRRQPKVTAEQTFTVTLPADLYQILSQAATEDMRTPELQAAWLLREWAARSSAADA